MTAVASNTAEKRGFTLMESVIAIGVVAILLTTFLAIFGPATQGIRRAISTQEADRLSVTLERELSILRESESGTNMKTAFDKAYDWIDKSSQGEAGKIFLYNYKGDPTNLRADGTMEPAIKGQKDYVLSPAVRMVTGSSIPSDMEEELEMISGPIFYVKATQLTYDSSGKLVLGDPGIVPPHPNQEKLSGGTTDADAYPEAVIAFTADFHLLRASAPDYLNSLDLAELGRPLFSRNMAVRR